MGFAIGFLLIGLGVLILIQPQVLVVIIGVGLICMGVLAILLGQRARSNVVYRQVRQWGTPPDPRV